MREEEIIIWRHGGKRVTNNGKRAELGSELLIAKKKDEEEAGVERNRGAEDKAWNKESLKEGN